MGQVLSMSQGRRDRAIKRAEQKVRDEEAKNRARMDARPPDERNTSLAKALEKFGSFTGSQLKKKDKINGNVQD